jgi:hypothetical protein
MNKIQELEKELEKQKALEKEQYKQKRIDEASVWIGKCFSSHLFKRVPAHGKEITIRKITGVSCDSDGRLLYKGLNATFRLHPASDIFQITIQEYSTQDQPFPSWISSFSHEISEELFDRVMEETKAHSETYFDKMRSIFKQNEYISQGEHSDEATKIKWLSKQKFIELPTTGYPNVKDILSWNNHPFLYGFNQLLNTKESIEIIKDIADHIEKNARSWGGSILERDLPRINVLREFYNKYKIN